MKSCRDNIQVGDKLWLDVQDSKNYLYNPFTVVEIQFMYSYKYFSLSAGITSKIFVVRLDNKRILRIIKVKNE